MMKKVGIGIALASIILIGGWLLATSNFFVSKSPNDYPFYPGQVINQDTGKEASPEEMPVHIITKDGEEPQYLIPPVHLITNDKDIGLELMPEDRPLGDTADGGWIGTYGFGLEQLHYTGGYVYLLRSTFLEDGEKFDIWRFPVDKETFQRELLEARGYEPSIFDKNYFYQLIPYLQGGKLYAELKRIKR